MVEKIIHQIILGDTPNDLIARCLDSWKVLIEYGFQIKLWDKTSTANFIDEYHEFALKAFAKARNLGEASDIARFLLVYHYGGYYVDWDIQLNSPEEFIELHEECPSGYLLLDPSNGTLAPEYFSAIINERYLLELVKDIVETYIRGERELMYTPQYSGPFRMKASLQRHPITSQSMLPVKEVFEYDYSEIRAKNEFGKKGIMTHFWSHIWM